jgi:hypothetical protein
MKKAKVFLAAMTVLAVVGGALAFKAKAYSSDIMYTFQGGACSPVNFLTSTPNGQPAGQFYETIVNANQCDLLTDAFVSPE